MGSPINTIIENMIDKLEGGTTFMAALTGGVHNKVPEGKVYPYCRVGDAIEDKFNTFGRDGKETYITVHIFSQMQSDEQVQTLAGLADDLLDNVSLSLTGWTPVLISWENTEVLIENDGRTHHAVMTYRIISQKG